MDLLYSVSTCPLGRDTSAQAAGESPVGRLDCLHETRASPARCTCVWVGWGFGVNLSLSPSLSPSLALLLQLLDICTMTYKSN
jgi:hypothetical protein